MNGQKLKHRADVLSNQKLLNLLTLVLRAWIFVPIKKYYINAWVNESTKIHLTILIQQGYPAIHPITDNNNLKQT